MANPQPDKHTRISNELLEALAKFRMAGELRQVFDAIMRMTYGFNRKWVQISNKKLSEMTGLKKQNVSRATSKLIELNLILVINNDYKDSPSYCIQKNYENWKRVIKIDYSNQKRLQPVINNDYKCNQKRLQLDFQKSPDRLSDKEQKGATKFPKDNLKTIIKESTNIYTAFFDRFWEKYPKRKGRKVGKKKCRELIVNKHRIKECDFEKVMTGLENYSLECDGLPKDPERFIIHETWNDYQELIDLTKFNSNGKPKPPGKYAAEWEAWGKDEDE